MFNMSTHSERKQGIVNRNYHVVKNLLNNESVVRIFAVDFLPFTFKRALRIFFENIFYKQEGKVIYRDITTKCVKSNEFSTELYIFSTIDSIFSKQKVIQKINKILDKINESSKNANKELKRITWSYSPMFVDYFYKPTQPSGIKSDLFIFDAVDIWTHHPSFSLFKKTLKDNYSIISQASDLIFTVSENQLSFFKKLGAKNVHWIANGVDFNFFAKAEQTKPLKDLDKITRPIIGYVGTIQNRIDLDLMEYLAKKNPDKSFVLVGPIWPVFLRKFRRPAIEIKKIKKYKNIYFLGRKSYKLTPRYINGFNLAIIPHKLDEFIKYTYSLKALEYLACGKPVVTTPASGVEKFSHLIYIAKDYVDFNKKIDLALKSDKIETSQQRKKIAETKDWQPKIKKMIELINQKI